MVEADCLWLCAYLTSASKRHVMATVFKMGDDKFLRRAQCTYDSVHTIFWSVQLLHDPGRS